MILPRLGAALVDASRGVDRAYRWFDSARSALVARYASDRLLQAYNDRAYARTPAYQPESAQFRSGLFNWEADAIAKWFPEPPAHILVGGAGGGREPLALSALGYRVTAFEPSPTLASAIPDANGAVSAYRGRYEELPVLRSADGRERVDIAAVSRFDAAILGWTSYSHIRTRAGRVSALERVARLVDGPVLVSFYLAPPAATPGRLAALADRLHLRSPHDRFTPAVGFYHLSTREELYEECDLAGGTVVHFSDDGSDGRWPFCVMRRRDSLARR